VLKLPSDDAVCAAMRRSASIRRGGGALGAIVGVAHALEGAACQACHDLASDAFLFGEGLGTPPPKHDTCARDTPAREHRTMLSLEELARLDPRLLIGAGGVAVLLLLLVIVRCCTQRSPRGGGGMKAALPAFDLEGNTASSVLPEAVTDAAAAGDVSSLRAWLSDERCIVDACATDGSTALHTAAHAGHAHVIRLLLEAGADALAVDADLRTPLHLVAAAGWGMCVKALLDAGSDPEARDAESETPMSLAESRRHMGCLRMMRIYQERASASAVVNGDRAHRRVK